MTISRQQHVLAEILLVEDNPGDVRLTREAFKESRVANVLHHVKNGGDAVAFLRREGDYTTAPRPDLILLDLNLPGMSGQELLAIIKGDPTLAAIPVVVLTTSEADIDILRSYQLQANCYVTKPLDFEQFIAAIRLIGVFWLAAVKLPSAAAY